MPGSFQNWKKPIFSWAVTREGGLQIPDFDLDKQAQTQVLQGKQVPVLRVGVKCMAMEPSCLGFESLRSHSLTLGQLSWPLCISFSLLSNEKARTFPRGCYEN